MWFALSWIILTNVSNGVVKNFCAVEDEEDATEPDELDAPPVP